MGDKRSYKQLALDTEKHLMEYNVQITYIENHLRNIDHHLEKINTTDLKQEVAIARNKDRISLIFRIGGGLLTLLTTGLVALILKLVGIY